MVNKVLIFLIAIVFLFGILFMVGAFDKAFKSNASIESSQPQTQSQQRSSSEIVITGKFDLEQGKPYFISATQDWDRWTYVGKVPERVTFELKYINPTQRTNYLVLPLDTTIATAKDLCEAKADNGQALMSDDDNIGYWDTLKQEIITPAPDCFEIKNVPGRDFNLEAGKIYRITVPGDRTWTQI
ncbi:MAG: hypothetical protein ACPLXC_00590 [Candidatus Pacearchaeota archaeon]